MNKRVLAILAAVIIVVLAVAYIVVTAVLRGESPQPTAEPSSHLPAPAAQEPSPEEDSGDSEASSPQPTPAVEGEDPDPQNVEEMAEAWLTVYGTRASDTDDSWTEQLEPWTGDELLEELPNIEDRALVENTPTEVQEVRIGQNISGWGPDTPIRWSHEATVVFTDAQGQDHEAIYRIQAYNTDDGWLITSAEFTGFSQRVQ